MTANRRRDMKAYIAAEGLSFAMASPERYRRGDEARRFRRCRHRRIATAGIATWRARNSSGSRGRSTSRSRAAVGAAYVDKNIRTWEAMQKVLDSGEHRPTHLRGMEAGPMEGR